jgi:hypothetical protein
MAGRGIRRIQLAAMTLAVLLSAGACSSLYAGPLGILQPPTATPQPTALSVSTTLPIATATATAAADQTTPAGSAEVCTGGPETKGFFAISANKADFDVYCAVLPAAWYVNNGTYFRPSSGDYIDIFYNGPHGAVLEFKEGAHCTISADECSTHLSTLGTTQFGALTGDMDSYGSQKNPDFVIYVDPGTKHGYTLIGSGLSQADLVAFAAAMNKVAKS